MNSVAMLGQQKCSWKDRRAISADVSLPPVMYVELVEFPLRF
jgi:hypothetical protein